MAPSLSNSSNVWSTTQPGREPGRSILFTTTMALCPSASALRVTKRVWGMGPSTASTSSSTPSTIDSTRSTSPPKSAWPGRVHDVDAGAAVLDGAVLRQDGDAALTLDVVRVHDPLHHLFVGGEGAGLPEEAVDQGGFAMVDVRDDRDVANGTVHGAALGLAPGETAGVKKGCAGYQIRPQDAPKARMRVFHPRNLRESTR